MASKPAGPQSNLQPPQTVLIIIYQVSPWSLLNIRQRIDKNAIDFSVTIDSLSSCQYMDLETTQRRTYAFVLINKCCFLCIARAEIRVLLLLPVWELFSFFLSLSIVLTAVLTRGASLTHRLCVQVLWGLFSWSDFIRLPARKG